MFSILLLIGAATATTCQQPLPSGTPRPKPRLTLLPSRNTSQIEINDAFCRELRPPGYETLENNKTFPYDLRAFWFEPDQVGIYVMNNMGFTWVGVLCQVRHNDLPVGTITFVHTSADCLQETLADCPPGKANTFYLTIENDKFHFLNMIWHPPKGFTKNQTIVVHISVMRKPGKHYSRTRTVKPILLDNMTYDDVSYYGLKHHLSGEPIDLDV